MESCLEFTKTLLQEIWKIYFTEQASKALPNESKESFCIPRPYRKSLDVLTIPIKGSLKSYAKDLRSSRKQRSLTPLYLNREDLL